MTRSADEIRAEMERWRRRQREAREARHPIDAAYAAIIVSTLAYVLGDVSRAAAKVKV